MFKIAKRSSEIKAEKHRLASEATGNLQKTSIIK